jgi:translocation and assembly module TamB
MHFNQMGSFLPSVNFMADARVSNIKVQLEVTGTLNNKPSVKLTSTPEKTETEIIQLLTLRDAYGNSTSNMSMGDILAIGLQMSILGSIEDTVKRTLGLDRFVFSTGSGSAFDHYSSDEDNGNHNKDEQFNISIGKYVTDKLMLRYTQGLNGDKITRYGIQYDINDNIGITFERERSEFIFSLEAMYKF